jgi:hypothetical protein
MAKIADSQGINWLGSKWNQKQFVLGIPGGNTANSGGIVYVERIDSSGDPQSGIWLHTDGTNLRMTTGATKPTNTESGGSVIGSAGADTALSNLASVQIPNAGDLIPANDNQVTLGDATHGFSVGYLSTSLVFIESTNSLTITASDCVTNAVTANIPDISAVSLTPTFMLDAGGTNDISYTKGTSTIVFGANADLDIAAGKAVDINAAVTIGATAALTTSGSNAIVLDQRVATTASPTFVAITCQGITNTTTAIDSTAAIKIGADNVKMSWGVSDETDSYIQFDGSGNMMLYDSNLGTARTLTEMFSGTTLNPTVTGNFTIQDGNFTWTNAAAGETAVWTLAATTVDGIQIVSSNTTAAVFSITADATANGELLYLAAAGGVGASGYYIQCYNGTATEFSIGQDGAIIAASTADVEHKISRNNATGTNPILEIEETNAAGGVALLIDSDHTGGVDAMQITYDGTASGLNITTTAVTSTQLTLAAPAAQIIAGLFMSYDWDGATDVGMIDVTSTGTHVHANTSLIYLEHNTGAPAASARGSCLRINDTTSNASDAWVGYISTTNNDGLLIETAAVADINLKLSSSAAGTGQMCHIDGTTGSWVGASDVGMVDLDTNGVLVAGANLLRVSATGANTAASFVCEFESTGNVTNSTDGIVLRITEAGTVAGTSSTVYIDSTANNGLEIQTTAIAATNLICTGSSGQTASMVKIDGTPTNGFVGASGVGMFHLVGDGTLADADASTCLINYTGTTASGANGSCLRIVDGGTSGGGSSYSVYIDAGTNMEAIHIDSGTVVVDETVQALGGILTKVAITDVADPPTQTNMDDAFGNAAAGNKGMIGVINDANGGANIWICASDGANWFYATKLIVGA